MSTLPAISAATSAAPIAQKVIVQRAPLVAPAVAMACGIAAGRYLSVPLGLWAVLLAAALAAGLLALRRAWLKGLCGGGIIAAIFCCGAVWASLAYHRVNPRHIVNYTDDGTVLATIRGQVVTEPQITASTTAYWQPPATHLLLETGGIRGADGQWLEASGLVRVDVAEPAWDLHVGQHVELVGELRRPRGPTNPGQCDWRQADRYQGIMVRCSVPGVDGVRVASQGSAGWLDRLRWQLRRHVLATGQREDALLVEALVLGDRHPALRSLNQSMVEAGTAHMLSISGMHLGIFLGFVYWLCRLALLPPRRAAWIVLAVLLLYVLLAEPSPPLLRSAVMAGALCVAIIAGRSVSTANALAAAAILLLAVDPLQLFTAGFQLSFGIVIGIVALQQPIRRLLFGRYLARRGLSVFRGTGRWRRGGRWLRARATEAFMSTVAVSAAAFLASVPLVAYHFGLFSPYASLLTLLLLPIMTAVLVPAYLSLALALAAPNLAAAIGEWASRAAWAMRQAVMYSAHLPALSIDLFAVPAWLVALFYLAVAGWALSGRLRLGKWAAMAVSAATLAAVVMTQLPAPPPPAARLHVLNVAHGSMTLLEAADGRTYLFDAGTLGSADAYQQVLRPFLRAMRLRRPSGVFVSHANMDHYNALPQLIQRTPPEFLCVSNCFAAAADDPQSARQLLRLCQTKGVALKRLSQGQELILDHHPTLTVTALWPPEDLSQLMGGLTTATRPATAPKSKPIARLANETSLVLRLEAQGVRVLLPGDIQERAEADLAALPAQQVRCQVLMLPHHGSATPAIDELVRSVNPRVLVQSSSYRSDPPELLSAIAGRQRYATFEHGWVCVELDGDDLRVQTMRQPAKP